MAVRIQSGRDTVCGGCCVEPCPLTTFCPAGPPAGVTFALAGITRSPVGPSYGESCICAASSFTATNDSILDCLNRSFSLPLILSPAYAATGDGLESPSPIVTFACQWAFANDCVNGPTPAPPLSEHVQYFVTSLFDIWVHGGTVYAALIVRLYWGGQDSALYCGAYLPYLASWPVTDFPCSGPWTLALFDGSDPPVSTFTDPPNTRDFTNFPPTVTVSATGSPGSLRVDGCCAPTFDICSPTTWNCTDGGCVDPGDGSGMYPTLAACIAGCAVCPTPPCGDGGPSEGNPDRIQTPCCARGETLPKSLRILLIPLGGGCACLGTAGGTAPRSFDLVWVEADKAWEAATVTDLACNSTLRVAVFCKNGQFSLRMWCRGALFVSIDGDYGTSTGCTPFDAVWTIGSGVNDCCDIAGAFQVHVFELVA